MSQLKPRKKLKISSTLLYKDAPFWEERVSLPDLPYVPPDNTHSLIDELKWAATTIKAARSADVLLLNCASGKLYPDLLAAIVIGLLPRSARPLMVLAGPMYEPNTGIKHVVERVILKLADRSLLRYVVWSNAAVEAMPQMWGFSREKMRQCNYFFTFTPADLEVPPPDTGNYVFSGGNSQRDYEPLIEAARLMPEQQFVIATRLLAGRTDLPPNLTAKPVAHAEFVRLMRGAQMVVIPMRQGMRRSAGEQTILNAMLVDKLVIANDSFGVHDVIHDGETGLVVAGTPESYAEAIRWSLAPENASQVAGMRSTARADVQAHYKYEDHLARLLEVIDEAADDPVTRARCKLGK